MIKERKWLVDLAGGAAVYPAAHQDKGIEMCPCSDFQTKGDQRRGRISACIISGKIFLGKAEA